MIGAQLLAAHNAAMECYRRAMIPETTLEGRRENLNQANKLSRTYASLLEALNRHRGKGQQKVTVEHVHVHSGGQAVVGVVSTPGGGEPTKSEDQPRAKQIAHATEPPMWSADTEGETVPITGMPNGRCRMHGGKSPGAPRAIATRGSTATTRRRQERCGNWSGNCYRTPKTQQSASEARDRLSVLTMCLLELLEAPVYLSH